MKLTLVTLALALAAPSAATAQVQTLDEGTFAISRNGTRIGREAFSIRRTLGAAGSSVHARSTVTFDGRRIVDTLRADSEGSVIQYSRYVFRGSERPEVYVGRASGGFFGVTLMSGRGGESRKEFAANQMTCLECHGDAHPTPAQRTPGSSDYSRLMERMK